MKDRIKRLNELIRRLLSLIFLKEFDLSKEIILTITKIDLSKDLKKATVYISIYPEKEKEKILKRLIKARGFFRKKLGQQLKIKFLPQLFFEIDKNPGGLSQIEEVFDQLKKKEKKVK